MSPPPPHSICSHCLKSYGALWHFEVTRGVAEGTQDLVIIGLNGVGEIYDEAGADSGSPSVT